MQGKRKKLRDNTGQYILPITHPDAVINDSGKTLTQTLSELQIGEGNTIVQTSLVSDTSLRRPTVVFLLDDTTAVHYNNMQTWIDRGARFTTGLRTDFVDSSLTYAMLREMQDKGFEIAYHGTAHNFAVGVLEADIASYLQIAEREGLKINGFIGPNGLWSESIVFHTYFDTFKWARGAGASNGVANVKNPVDFFKLIYDSNSFIDDLTTQASLDTLKLKIDALATRGTGVLTLSMHMTNAHLPYVEGLLDYILSKNIEIKTVSEAYETYGAVLEFYDSNLQLGSDFTKREDGNGGTTINASSSHFILQKDGTVISNIAGVKRITPVYKNKILNGNTVPNDFEVGISIVQYGSSDDKTGFPNVGTLYNFNLGKNNGQQFQLFKASGKGGIYFRESNTDNTWKTTMSDNKLGIYRVTKPTTPTSTGNQGDFSADANYLYICYADNAWIRVPKDSTWV